MIGENVKKDPDFAKLHVGNLTFYAVEVRYPNEFYIPSVEEAQESFEIVLKVKDFILEKLNIKESE
jgi:hypothetical protein